MKLVINGAKFLINLFAKLIKSNKDILNYLLSKSLKNEVENYIDEKYYVGYAHIDKAIRLLIQYKIPDFVIVDVGGADGRTSKIFADNFPKNKIFTFEPIEENFIQLKVSAQNYQNIVPYKKALGNIESKIPINIAARITSSSIYKLNPDEQSAVFSNNLIKSRTEEIEITRLDSIISKDMLIGVLKLDVQGYEVEVLKGAEASLSNTIIIVLEMNNHNYYSGAPKYFVVDEFLRNKNFVLYDIFPSTKDSGRLKEWDVIYVNQIYIK